ncbi:MULTISPECIES: sugar phosphate isomerase/epimerase family protein [Actinoalloteichus]|uniref:Xylose isomerase-like enzyme n=1 Tax=Actinoalloteichus fjordicus TaxID=1612552 RepID=A0AAC9LE03_9PSEU|nr:MULTISPECIES: TIM barrel protein [Actinoalloteichus]APU16233.1 xylose isomerase-like enzyme [Actinoalloteichus fjordicus]APU22293.1 xylose isomerase-like enzyme [Actinoalloteichus sp. GBA129-24]
MSPARRHRDGCAVGLVDWRLPEAGPDAVRRAGEVGVDGVQLDLGGPGRGPRLDAPGRLDAVRDAVEATGVRVLAVAGNHLNDIGLTARADSHDATRVRLFFERLLDAAQALGAPLAFAPSFGRSVIDGPEAFARTAAVLRAAARAAAERGLLLGSENVLGAHQARRLAEAVDSPALRLVLDPANLVAAGLHPIELIGATSELLADQVHLKPPPDAGPSGADLDSTMVTETLVALREQHVPVRVLVSENDYRDGDADRLAREVDQLRRRAAWFVPSTIETT